MAGRTFVLLSCLSSVVFAGNNTEEDLAHYIIKEPSTDMPWTSNEKRINKMILDEINKYNYAPETTECPIDSQGRPRPTEGRQPTWWNAYRQAKDGDRPDWSAEIKELIKNPRTFPPWTPSQESEPIQSRWKTIEPFTWRPGAPVINLRIKTDATTRPPSGPQELTTERSIVLSSVHWDTSEEGGGGGGTEPPLNLAPLQEGYVEDNSYLKVKPRRRKLRKISTGQNKRNPVIILHPRKEFGNKISSSNCKHQEKSCTRKMKDNKKKKQEQSEIKMNRGRKHRSQYNAQNINFARIWEAQLLK